MYKKENKLKVNKNTSRNVLPYVAFSCLSKSWKAIEWLNLINRMSIRPGRDFRPAFPLKHKLSGYMTGQCHCVHAFLFSTVHLKLSPFYLGLKDLKSAIRFW